MAYGVWVPKVDTSWEEFGLRSPPPSTTASPVGQVDPGAYERFLIAFREAIELNDSVEDRRTAIMALKDRDGELGSFWAEHARANDEWFDAYLGFCKALGLPESMHSHARKLYHAGYRSASSLRGAADEELLKVKGIGRKTLDKIRQAMG